MLTIVILSLFLITYGIYNEFKERSSEQKRVKTLDSFLKATEADLSRQTYIMGFRAIFIIESAISASGSYSSNVNAQVNEIIQNGTLKEVPQPLMVGATLPEITALANEKASKLNAELTLSQPTIQVFQRDPWQVIVQINTTLVLNDKNDKANWTIRESIETPLRVENFEDPLYLVSTNGLVTHKIIRTPYENFTQGADVTNLIDHATNSYYTATSLAPSFIQRLEGNLTPSENGIESLVNLQELSGAGITVQDKSVVDHLYFSPQNPSAYRIQGMPSWFKIDDAHLQLYGVEELIL